MASPRCKVCDDPTRPLSNPKTGALYHCCDECDYISLDAQHLPSPEAERARYLQHRNSLDNHGYVDMLRDFIARAVTPYRQGARTALDFGCGPGPALATLLTEMGIRTEVYDVHFAPERVFEGKTYDIVTATEVFEHLPNPVETLGLLRDRLAPGGVIAIMTLFHPCNDAQFLKWWYRNDITHVSFYTPRTLRKMARRVSLDIAMTDGKNVCVMRRPKPFD